MGVMSVAVCGGITTAAIVSYYSVCMICGSSYSTWSHQSTRADVVNDYERRSASWQVRWAVDLPSLHLPTRSLVNVSPTVNRHVSVLPTAADVDCFCPSNKLHLATSYVVCRKLSRMRDVAHTGMHVKIYTCRSIETETGDAGFWISRDLLGNHTPEERLLEGHSRLSRIALLDRPLPISNLQYGKRLHIQVRE